LTKRLHLPAVGKSRKKPVIGILGGIGSGKSTVAAEFARLGCAVIDADKIAHELLGESEVKEKVVTAFGSEILDSAGKIDRKKLAEIAFGDAAKLTQLNKFIHPVVIERAEALIEHYNRQNTVKAIVLDMPLLAEVGWDKRCDKLIFVHCDRAKRVERAKKKGLFDKNQLKIMENFQFSLDNKADIAENTIDNNSGFSALAGQVAGFFSCIVDNG